MKSVQGRSLRDLQIEHIIECRDETRRILLWELHTSKKPFYCKYFALKLSQNFYCYGPAMRSLRSCLQKKSIDSIGPFLRRIDAVTTIHPCSMPLLGKIEYPTGSTSYERKALTILEFAANIKHHDFNQETMNQFYALMDDDDQVDVMMETVLFAGTYACAVWKIDMENEGGVRTDIIVETARILLAHYEVYLRRYEHCDDVTNMLINLVVFARMALYATKHVIAMLMDEDPTIENPF